MRQAEAIEYLAKFLNDVELSSCRVAEELKGATDEERQKIQTAAHDEQLAMLKKYMRVTSNDAMLTKLRGEICEDCDALNFEIRELREECEIAQNGLTEIVLKSFTGAHCNDDLRLEATTKNERLIELLGAIEIKEAAVDRLRRQYAELLFPDFEHLCDSEIMKELLNLKKTV